MKTIDKYRRRAQRFGAVCATKSAILDGLNLLVHLRLLRVVELHAAWVDTAALRPNTSYRCGFMVPSEITGHAKDPENCLSEKFTAMSLGKRDRCFGVIDGKTLASYGWYSTQPTKVGRDMLFRFPQSFVYMFHGFTRPEYRGQRLHSLGIARATLALAHEGYAGVVALVESTNWASRASAHRLGFNFVGTIVEVGNRRAPTYFLSRRVRLRGCKLIRETHSTKPHH